jgi:hypothetical protein
MVGDEHGGLETACLGPRDGGWSARWPSPAAARAAAERYERLAASLEAEARAAETAGRASDAHEPRARAGVFRSYVVMARRQLERR